LSSKSRPPAAGNLFSGQTCPQTGELFGELLRCRNVSIERILSSDAPNPVRYDQVQDEWVILLEGRATLELAGAKLDLAPGDYVYIPAQTPHCVIATLPEPRCVWLAVHIYPEDES
jgi:cupin 2 domain-containing protein